MFSGKSSELVRRVRRHSLQQREVLMIKYCFDNRYTDADKMSTHDKVMMAACSAGRLDAVVENEATAQKYADAQVIGIDEGQFFPDIVEFCERAANQGKIVIVAALDGTFEKKPFGRILDLIPLAEKLDKLNAVCTVCYSDAAFTFRKSDDTAVELIGGAEMYVPLCRSCFAACKSTQLCERATTKATKAAAASIEAAAAEAPVAPGAETTPTVKSKKAATKIECGLEGVCATPGESDLLG